MSEVVELRLTDEQERLIKPIVSADCTNHRNTLFVSTMAPDMGTWRMQVVSFPRGGSSARILKVIQSELEKAKSDAEKK